MTENKGNLLVGCITIIFAVLFYVGALELPKGGPGKMPEVVSAIMLICGILLAIGALRSHGYSPRLFGDINITPVAGLLLISIVAVSLFDIVGSYTMLALMMGILNWLLLGRPRTMRRLAGIVFYAIGATIVIWLAFRL
ncbi:MAG: tripartite tricarboxylate transporter TctB family protein, partial [Candidatus Saccharimonadales bacterium]